MKLIGKKSMSDVSNMKHLIDHFFLIIKLILLANPIMYIDTEHKVNSMKWKRKLKTTTTRKVLQTLSTCYLDVHCFRSLSVSVVSYF